METSVEAGRLNTLTRGENVIRAFLHGEIASSSLLLDAFFFPMAFTLFPFFVPEAHLKAIFVKTSFALTSVPLLSGNSLNSKHK